MKCVRAILRWACARPVDVHQPRQLPPDHDAEVKLLHVALARLERESLDTEERAALASFLARIEETDWPDDRALSSGIRKALGMPSRPARDR